MNRVLKTGLLGLLLLPVLAQGQEIGLIRLAPERPKHQRDAAVWGGVEEGRFRSADMALFQWSAGARVSGVRHRKHASRTGSLSFGQTTGKDMSSSMFLDPGYYPLDFLETGRGWKSRQDVRLEGGYVHDLGDAWAAGLQVSAQAMHVAKKQAVSHSSLGLDLQMEPTVTYVMDDEMGIAVAGILRMRTEWLRLPETDDASAVFLDQGMRYGSGFSAGNSPFGVLEPSFGASAILYSPEVTVGVKDVWKRGQAGDRFRYPGSTVSVFAERTLEGFGVDHVYGVSYRRMRDQLREDTPSGDQPFTSLSDRVNRALELKYGIRLHHGAVRSVGLVLEGSRWVERCAVPLPDLTKRNLGSATLSASFSRGAFDLDVDVLAGGGLWRDKGRSRDERTDTDYRRTENWLRQMDYQMVPRIGAGGALTFRVPSVQGLYLRLDGRWRRALRLTLMGGHNRETGTFTVGYKF